jgi:hypothetical protein
VVQGGDGGERQANRCSGWSWRDAWFALGAFVAPAPWRGVWSNALTGSGAGVGWGVLLGSRLALFLRPHRGAVFKQRPHRFGRGFGWGACRLVRAWGFFGARTVARFSSNALNISGAA